MPSVVRQGMVCLAQHLTRVDYRDRLTVPVVATIDQLIDPNELPVDGVFSREFCVANVIVAAPVARVLRLHV